MAKVSFNKMKHIMRNRNIIMHSYQSSCHESMYGLSFYMVVNAECWTINKEMEKKLEAAEMWFLRRMLQISWTEKISNVEVTKRAGVTPSLINTVRRRQMNFVGHVYRKDGIEKTSMTGKIEGKRGRGRQRLTYLQSLNNWATNNQINNTSLLRIAENRQDWRNMIADVCNNATDKAPDDDDDDNECT